ncbi:MAG: tRNA (adenosine(37)-N6)-threonylcarbamoyltransferase complex dimerization subunit type 1 TsaB, partial [Myxococcales bacterium]
MPSQVMKRADEASISHTSSLLERTRPMSLPPAYWTRKSKRGRARSVLGGLSVLWLLGIDTATRRGHVALGRVADTGTPPSAVHVRRYDGGVDHAERVLGELDALLGEAGITPAQIGALVVGLGPGTFTGVRVGVTTAKALAMATGLQAVGVGSLETMAHACPVDPERPRVAVIDARRAELFVAAYDAAGRELRAPSHVRRDALAAWGAGLDGAVALGEIDGLDDILAAAGWRPYRSEAG